MQHEPSLTLLVSYYKVENKTRIEIAVTLHLLRKKEGINIRMLLVIIAEW